MSAGHGGASGRYDYLKEIALDYAFLLQELGSRRGLSVLRCDAWSSTYITSVSTGQLTQSYAGNLRFVILIT